MSNGEELAAFDERLDAVSESLAGAKTEADLDDVEEELDAIEVDLDEAAFDVEADEDDVGEADADDETDEGPKEALEDRIEEFREDVAEQRGPYVEDVSEVLRSAERTIKSSEWTEEGEAEVAKAATAFFDTAAVIADLSITLETDEPDGIADRLEAAASALEDAGLDPDDDAEAIESLLEAAESLTDELDDAQVLGDLEVREQLRRLGFYDVLEPQNMRDFPPEWNAVKLYEQRGEVEPLLLALEKLDSNFMEENILDALEHMAPPEAYDAVLGLAKRRNKQPVRILGKIGDERACSTLENFLGGGDVKLEEECLRALGCIGNPDSTEPVAQRLAADNPLVRGAAARALGLLGDTRAIEPLADVLESDDEESVRASAAWALNQIGTEAALEAVVAYQDDQSYLVQVEAEKATGL